jgi:hypothetical protein
MKIFDLVYWLPFIVVLGLSQSIVHAESLFENLEFSVGGRIKIDAVYNDRSSSNGKLSRSDLSFSPGSIPVTGNNPDSFNFNLRESRLWATSHIPLYNRDLAAYAEIDFFPIDRNNGRAELSNKPRLRHAYATFGGFTAGRTFTAFLNVAAYPEINDANGPLGILSARQELLRYGKSFDWGAALLSLEEPDSKLTTTTGITVAPDDTDLVPDIITKIEFTGDWGNWSVAAMVREIRSNGILTGGMDDSQWGGALSVAGRIYTSGQNNVRFSAAYGNVLGRYLSFNTFDDGVMDSNGMIDLTEILGGYLAYQHWWTYELRSTLAIGYAQADHNLSIAPVTVDRRFYSTHLNLIWSPSLNSSVGIEWLHGYREREDDRDGNLNRMQLTVIYKF